MCCWWKAQQMKYVSFLLTQYWYVSTEAYHTEASPYSYASVSWSWYPSLFFAFFVQSVFFLAICPLPVKVEPDSAYFHLDWGAQTVKTPCQEPWISLGYPISGEMRVQ